MTGGSAPRFEGLGIVMTDLFISGGAALLLVLAVARPTPETPLPVQADLVAACPTTQALEKREATLVLRPAGSAADDTRVEIRDPAQLAGAPAALGLPARLFYGIALVRDRTSGSPPLSARCLRWVGRDLVGAYNAQIETLAARGGARPVFGLSVGAEGAAR